MRIPQHNTNLRGRRALLRELADLIDDLFGRDFEPGGRGTRVGDRAGRDAFAVAVEATHDLGNLVELSIDFVGFGARTLGLRDSVVVGAKSCASGGFSECGFLALKTFLQFPHCPYLYIYRKCNEKGLQRLDPVALLAHLPEEEHELP